MRMLSIDSSGKTAAVAVTEDGLLVAQSFTDAGLTHSQTLLPLVDSVLKLSGTDIEHIDEFAFTAGPGSFTGLRIGASLVMGLAENRPLRPVSTLSALAHNLIRENCVIFPVMDARRNQVYTAVFESDGVKLKRLTDDAALTVDEVVERINGYNGRPVRILGDGAYLFEHVCGANISMPQGKELYTQGYSVALAAAETAPVGAEQIKLSYLRMSQAERELKEKQKK